MEDPSRIVPDPEPTLRPYPVKSLVAALLVLLVVAVPAPPPEPAPRSWDVLAVLVEELRVEVPGIRGPRRVRTRLTATDAERIREELAAFARRVGNGTEGALAIRLRVATVPGPITTLTGPGPYWIGPEDVSGILPDVGRADTVLVFAKVGGETGPGVPVRHLGGAVGGDRGPGGACFAAIGFRPGWIDGSGTVALHEFLHGFRWALVNVSGIPGDDLPDPDEGRAGPTCCDDAPEGDSAFADHLLARHVTRRMCASADARRAPGRTGEAAPDDPAPPGRPIE